MDSAALRHRSSLLLFVGIAAGVYAAALAIVGSLPPLAARASVVAVAVALDMVVVVPAAFVFLVVRQYRLPLVTVVPVFVLGALAASRVLPADQQRALAMLEVLAVPVELGLLGWIGWRASKAVRAARSHRGADPLELLRRAAFDVTRNDRASAILATEIAVFWYAIASWRCRPHEPEGASAFTHHRRSGHAGIVTGFVMVMVVEALAVHLLVLQWSTIAAWVLTIGTAYGALWLIADYRATVLRPVLATEDEIVIRAGLRCTLHVARDRIIAIGRQRPDFGRESVDLTFLGEPTHWLTLSSPAIAEGPYGLRRSVRGVGVEPDAAREFERALGAALS